MKTPTISEIAYLNKMAGLHYFDRKTMRFFGQKMSDFKRKRLSDGRIVVYCRQHRGWNIPDGIVSLAFWDEKSYATQSVPEEHKANVIAEIEN